MSKKIILPVALFILLTALTISIFFFSKKDSPIHSPRKISIITTLFPTYDIVKNIAGEKGEVSLLLPPGMEPHSFEPTPSDIVKIHSADFFVYTGDFMEPWAKDILQGSPEKTLAVINAGKNIPLIASLQETEHSEESSNHNHEEKKSHEYEHSRGEFDPHIWLDFDNVALMTDAITSALSEKYPQDAAFFQENATRYKQSLSALDEKYRHQLSACKTKTIIYGGHYAFGYLANRYGLDYRAAQGFSPDAEPTAEEMGKLIEQTKKENLRYIFYEELSSPKIAEVLAEETEAQLLLLNGAHNLSKEDYEKNVSFFGLMDSNLHNLVLGLECSQKK